MPPWRNGIRKRLKIFRPQGHVGSSPTGGKFRTPYRGVLNLPKGGLKQKEILFLPSCLSRGAASAKWGNQGGS